MSKRVLAIVLLLMAVAVPSAPVVEAHNDDADVVIEWNGILQSSLALPLPRGRQGLGCRCSVTSRCYTSRCSMR